MKTLVVADASDSRRAIAEYFGARGWNVTFAHDGADAVAQAVTRGVDVVIVASSLPGLEGRGYEAAAILRRVAPRARVVLTVDDDVEVEPRESQHMERFRCFPKPLNFASIARAIEETEDAR